ncbi:MAG: hypothetical protein GF308_06310 [Candidatus Heimdallarchaeota archaeon]|nr:hypothetical protein [Candidatus Heimdallarchaeota archaeon]
MTKQFIRAFIETYEKVSSLITKSQGKLTEDIRTKIYDKVIEAKIFVNKLLLNEEITVEQKIELVEQSLQIINNILVNKPEAIQNLFWYELETIRRGNISLLMGFWGEAGILRVTGTANALANILMGIEPIDINDIYVEYGHPEYLKRYSLTYNILNQSSTLYYNASTALYNISEEKFKEWTTLAIKSQAELLQFHRKTWIIPRLYEIAKERPPESISNGFAVMIQSISQILNCLVTLHARCGGQWPEEIRTNPLLDSTNTKTVIDSLAKLSKEVEGYIQDLERHQKQGTFKHHKNILAYPVMEYTYSISEQHQYVIEGLKAIYELVIKGEKDTIGNLQKCNNSILAYLQKNKEKLNDKDFMVSTLGDESVNQFEFFLFFAAIESISTKNRRPLQEMKEALGIYLQEEGRKRFPQIYAIYLVGQLTFTSNEKDHEQMEKLAEELICLAPLLVFQPRDSFTFLLMGHLTKMVRGKETPEQFNLIMHNELEKRREFLYPEIIDDVENYLRTVRNAINGKKPNYAFERAEKNPFDPYSILIPNYTKITKNQGFINCIKSLVNKIRNRVANKESVPEWENIRYIPFNLSTDFIFSK